MNHKISSHVISLKPLKIFGGLSTSVEHGIGIRIDGNDLNEIINQRITMEVLEEIKRLGLKLDITQSWQEKLFPLIDMFYEVFANKIKDVYITGELMPFVKDIGEDNYDEFKRLMFFKCFMARKKIANDQKDIISENDIKEIENNVVSMIEVYNKQNDNFNVKK